MIISGVLGVGVFIYTHKDGKQYRVVSTRRIVHVAVNITCTVFSKAESTKA